VGDNYNYKWAVRFELKIQVFAVLLKSAMALTLMALKYSVFHGI
jgi:hypothetical protein